jgi:hypothetical protein
MLNTISGLLGGGAAPTDYESIATTTVGAGGAGSITFSSIPSTYTHLQIRTSAQQALGGGSISLTFNGATFNYRHYLYGNGSSALAGADTTNSPGIFSTSATSSPSVFASSILDILDYTSTNKNKVTRSLGGSDINGSGNIFLMSGLFTSSTAINSITITAVSQNFTQYSSFALYGIK